MGIIIGVIYHFIGGAAAGSFYMPYTKVKKWAWESMWITGGFFSWLFIPPLMAWVTVPGFIGIIHATDFSTLLSTYIFGVLWGIGGLTYGLGVRYLGMSLGNSIIISLTAILGALVPAIYYDFSYHPGKVTFMDLLHNNWGHYILIGILIFLVGIIISGKAGMMKEKELSEEELEGDAKKKGTEFKIGIGLIVAVISGVLSACFNFGIEAGTPMAQMAVQRGVDPLFKNNVIFVVILWGGFTTNFIWCLILNARNKSFGDYVNKETPLVSNYLLSAIAGTTWFFQFFFYGMGESKLGNGASSWILHMAFIILIANIWGLVLKEWKGVTWKTIITVSTGIAVIFIAIIIVGFGNGLKP
jgi:L-rhamnose-H+ transport protein